MTLVVACVHHLGKNFKYIIYIIMKYLNRKTNPSKRSAEKQLKSQRYSASVKVKRGKLK